MTFGPRAFACVAHSGRDSRAGSLSWAAMANSRHMAANSRHMLCRDTAAAQKPFTSWHPLPVSTASGNICSEADQAGAVVTAALVCGHQAQCSTPCTGEGGYEAMVSSEASRAFVGPGSSTLTALRGQNRRGSAFKFQVDPCCRGPPTVAHAVARLQALVHCCWHCCSDTGAFHGQSRARPTVGGMQLPADSAVVVQRLVLTLCWCTNAGDGPS